MQPWILVVDDDDALRRIVLRIINRISDEYAIVEARQGKDALTKLAKHENAPVLIITDVDMPEMNGLDLIAELQAQEGFNVPIILMSGDINRPNITDMKSKGWIQKMIEKPFSPRSITVILRTHLSNI